MTTGGLAGFGSGGVLPQAASATAAREPSKLKRADNIGTGMWILMLEAGVALFLLVFIVWWTMYLGPKPGDDEADTPAAPAAPDDTSAPGGPQS